MVDGYVDMFDISMVKLFAGAGIGVSKIKEKQSWAEPGGISYSDSSKNKTNFAYQLTIGASAEIALGANAELAYKWMNYGKIKFKKDANQEPIKGKKFKGHHILTGVRFHL
jgi:opacity protein-like surface antigen